MFPRLVIRGDQEVITVRNLLQHPVRIQKGQPIASLSTSPPSLCYPLQVAEWERVIPGLAKLAGQKREKQAARCLLDLIDALKEEDVLEKDAYSELEQQLSKIHQWEKKPESVGTPADEDRYQHTTDTRQDELASPACHGKHPLKPENNPVVTHFLKSQNFSTLEKRTSPQRELNTTIHSRPLTTKIKGSVATMDGYAVQMKFPLGQSTFNVDSLGLEDEFPDVERDSVVVQVPVEQRPPHSNPDEVSPLDSINFQINPKVDVSKVTAVLSQHLPVFGFAGRRLGSLEHEMRIDASQIPPA